jgi:hypothetical protein
MAGDIFELRHGDLAREIVGAVAAKFKYVVYVPGNHEFWGPGINPFHGWKRLKKIEREFPNFHALNNELLELDGQRFYGGTMWFPEPPERLVAMKFKKRWPDYFYVEKFEPWVYDSNRLFRENFQVVQPGDVVVTHHMPSYQSVAPRYAGDPSNHFYLTPMEDLILAHQPAVWVHGHTHDNFDYRIGETRVVCNPFGYPHEMATKATFVDQKLVSL